MKLQLPGKKTRYWQVFWLCLLAAAALFAPHCLVDAVAGGGYFHYAGDFNDQQINFYQYANSFIKQGGSFSWATDLGSGFVNSYSFYLLGSPFFWLTLLVPARFMPWMMVPLLCLKIALAGGGGYLWARRWVRDEDWSMLAGCLYAFSGFTVYNIFFNHFLDVVALFPYMLAALDDAVIDGKKGRFPFWVAVNLLNNYFFFAGQAVFLIIYFFCMLAGHAYKIGPRKFALLAGETLLGCAMGCVLLLPAGLSLLQNPRTIDPFNGMGYLVYGKAQQYGAIFYSAFLMPDAPYFKDMFSEGILKHTSMTAYLPVVGIAGGLAFCRGRRSHPFTYILKVCVVCAFVPILNSLFYALNSSYYARWYYMPVLVLCGATASLLARPHLARRELPRAWGLTLAVTLSAAAFGLVPYTDDDGVTTLGVTEEPARFWAILGVSVLGLVIFGVLWHFFRDRQRWPTALLAAVLVFSFVFGVTMDIEFKGGAMVTVGYQGDVDLNNVKQTVAAELGQSNLTVQTGTDVSGAQTLTINLPGSETLSTEQLDSMIETLNTTYPDNQFVQQEVSNVNPTIGNEFLAKSVVAVVAACVLILVYVAVRFRRIGGWSAGAMAIVALLHDMFVVYGVFVLLRIPLNGNFIAAMLTILGYSINDTVVIYDRIRENTGLYGKKMSLPELVNLSINQSFGRSMMTSITTCIALAIVCVVSIIFKLDSIFTFAVPLLFGMVSGVYSTMCIATQLWVSYKTRKAAPAPKKA